jgi:hypothetical protein
MFIRQISRKTNIFLVYVRKEKIYLIKSIIFSNNFYLFHKSHMNIDLL